jgi:hypothetical protein
VQFKVFQATKEHKKHKLLGQWWLCLKSTSIQKISPAKAQRRKESPLETRQRFAPLRLCAKDLLGRGIFRAKLVNVALHEKSFDKPFVAASAPEEHNVYSLLG